MFALEKFRMVERKRAVTTAKLVHANDNCRGARHAPATPGRAALVGHWRKNAHTGRLEWHWSLAPIADDLSLEPSVSAATRSYESHRPITRSFRRSGRPQSLPRQSESG